MKRNDSWYLTRIHLFVQSCIPREMSSRDSDLVTRSGPLLASACWSSQYVDPIDLEQKKKTRHDGHDRFVGKDTCEHWDVREGADSQS